MYQLIVGTCSFLPQGKGILYSEQAAFSCRTPQSSTKL